MRFVLLFFLLFPTALLHAQNLDSLLSNNTLRTDSLSLPGDQKLDSIQYSFYKESDSLKMAYKTRLASLDSSQNHLQHRIDSLKGLQLPTGEYTHKLDSVMQERQKTVGSLNKKMEDLKAKATGKIEALDLPPQLKDKAATVTNNIQDFKLPVKDLNIPSLNMPDNPLKSLDGMNTAVQSPIGKIGEIDGLANVQENIGGLSNITEQAGGYQEDLQNITQGNLKDVQQVPQALENKAADVAGIGDIQTKTELDPVLDAAKSPEAAKEQAIQKAQEVAVNHFAGKEQVLQEAMDKMSKLKSKYSSLNSLSEIPKKRPNEMRGKPLIERLMPGIAMQIQKKNSDLLVDFNPYVGYRFTGRLTSGLGWNQRVGYNTKHDTFSPGARIFGPRVYSEFKLGKGFAPRGEVEFMNTYVPSRLQVPHPDNGRREWVPGVFFGMKKDYKFVKNVKGTALIMLRVFNPEHKSPYADVLNVRFGFEFPMKKKVKKPVAEEQPSK